LLEKGNKAGCEEGEPDVNSQGKLTAFPHKNSELLGFFELCGTFLELSRSSGVYGHGA